jgi:hypothetical protein
MNLKVLLISAGIVASVSAASLGGYSLYHLNKRVDVLSNQKPITEVVKPTSTTPTVATTPVKSTPTVTAPVATKPASSTSVVAPKVLTPTSVIEPKTVAVTPTVQPTSTTMDGSACVDGVSTDPSSCDQNSGVSYANGGSQQMVDVCDPGDMCNVDPVGGITPQCVVYSVNYLGPLAYCSSYSPDPTTYEGYPVRILDANLEDSSSDNFGAWEKLLTP